MQKAINPPVNTVDSRNCSFLVRSAHKPLEVPYNALRAASPLCLKAHECPSRDK